MTTIAPAVRPMTAQPELADRIEAMKEALGIRVIDAMYAANPFWEERFGARGRRHADQDAAYHLSYLASALRIGSASVMTEYARWLRGVLVPRGMCSRHLEENFEKMREAIVSAKVPDAEAALDLLALAVDALRHRDGAAGRIERSAPATAARVAGRLLGAPGEGTVARGDEGRARLEEDLRYHLAYLADAAATKRPELFAEHVVFAAGSLARRGIPPAHLLATLAALEADLGASLGGEGDASSIIASCLAAARGRLAHPEAPERPVTGGTGGTGGLADGRPA